MTGDVADVLAAECERVSEVVVGLDEADFGRPTRCPPWDVKVLLAHMWRGMDRIPTYLSKPAPAEPDADSIAYWRRYDPVGDAPSISDRSYEVAGRFAAGTNLARSFAQHWPACLETARRTDPGRVVATFSPALRLDEYLRTRVLEMAVHGLDLTRALGREPWITAGGSLVTREILVGLLEAEPPGTLQWDDLTFIETGTGRRALSDSERDILGNLAERFPLLG